MPAPLSVTEPVNRGVAVRPIVIVAAPSVKVVWQTEVFGMPLPPNVAGASNPKAGHDGASASASRLETERVEISSKRSSAPIIFGVVPELLLAYRR